MHSNPHLNLQYDQLQHQVGGPDQFLITREMLAEVVETNSGEALQRCGGLDSIVSALRSNVDAGILGDQGDLHFRRQAFGSNSNPLRRPPPTTTIFKHIKHLFSHAFKDSTILLLLCCATLSLAIGVKTNGAAEGFIDGAMILLAISLVVSFGGLVRFFKARLTMIKIKKSANKGISVVRNGVACKILESELVVGDIVWLQSGDRVPADGILINGGDSFQLNDGDLGRNTCSNISSLFTGSRVVEGWCRMVVTAVGDNTERSKLMKSIGDDDDDDHRLQLLDAIEETNSKLEKIWLSLSLIILLVQFVRCFVMRPVHADKDPSFDTKNTVEDLMKESMQVMKERKLMKANSLITMLCVLLFASRDGLSLAVFITLVYASNRMKFKFDAIVHHLQSSAAVGSITTVCTCKTVDLALNHAKMADLWIGVDLVIDIDQLSTEILDALRRGILVHMSRADESRVEEISLVTWARAVLRPNTDLDEDDFHRDTNMDMNLRPFSIVERESKEDHKVLHVHCKGPPKLILSICSHYYTIHGKIEALDANKKAAFLQIVDNNIGCGERCFAFAYKRVIEEEDEDEDEDADKVDTLKTSESDLTLLGFVCLKNPYSGNVMEAIEDCKKSGVEVKLIVDDDINTARIMAVNSGILNSDDESSGGVIEAVDFRRSSDSDRMIMVDNIRVMANASPADKLLMVQCLRQKSRIVSAAAAATRDSPLLKEADVGISMGDGDGDIIVPSNNFSRIPGIVNLGRRVCRDLEKFMQLQLTMEISAFTVNIISLVATRKEALSSFEVLWVNLVVEILGAVAVAVATIDVGWSNRVHGSSGIINRGMWRSVAVQCLFQVAAMVAMVVKGKTLFEVNESALEIMVFNCYAFCQVFMLIPAAAVELERDGGDVVAGVFRGRRRSCCLFLGIVAITGVLQVVVVEIMGVVDHRKRLEVKQWCICIGIASFSLPLNCAANWIN
ncbi:hypothetical protein C2S51_009896 [Perilla frutescens var. frutescens]|nr:hypothetical protein C2S51_009896 [Perilla frutescens var. frutescens]